MGLVYYEIRGLDSDHFDLRYICQRPRQELYEYKFDGHLSHLNQAVFYLRADYWYVQLMTDRDLL